MANKKGKKQKDTKNKNSILNCDYKIELVQDCNLFDVEAIVDYIRNHYRTYHYAYIVHDCDLHDDGTPKLKHFHLIIWNSIRGCRVHLQKLTDNFNIPLNSFQKTSSLISSIQYLIHYNDPDKFQYSLSQVVSDTDLSLFFSDNDYQDCKNLPQVIIDFIHNKITYYKCVCSLTPVQFSKYRKLIEDTLLIHNMTTYSRNLKVIYIQGDSGSGKTTYAKYIAEQNSMSYFISGSNNDPLQNYSGQDCIILDDFRASSMPFNDLLKMLDPYTNSLVRSRYSNKYITDCKLIILTSIFKPCELYFSDDTAKGEQLKQLYRRMDDTYLGIDSIFGQVWKFDCESNMSSEHVRDTKDFMNFGPKYINPILY